jgi:cobalamin biosynthesis protein CobD/CbiB
LNENIRSDDPKTLWQEQPVEEMTMSLEDVRNRISTLEKKVRKRNLVGGFATVVVLFSCAYFAVVLPNVVERIGAVLTIVGAG